MEENMFSVGAIERCDAIYPPRGDRWDVSGDQVGSQPSVGE